MIDSDTGFVHVLAKRLESRGWQLRAHGPAPVDELVAMRLNAVVGGPRAARARRLGVPRGRCDGLPGLGVVVCTGPSTVAQRVRGLRLGADDWITKPCHPEEVIARVEAVVRRRKRDARLAQTGRSWPANSRSGPTSSRRSWAAAAADLTRREFEVLQLLADAEGRSFSARRSTSACGATRWRTATARWTCSCASCGRSSSASPNWRYIHTHFGIGYRFQPEPLDVDGGTPPSGEGARDETEATPAESSPKRARGEPAGKVTELRSLSAALSGNGALGGVRL